VIVKPRQDKASGCLWLLPVPSEEAKHEPEHGDSWEKNTLCSHQKKKRRRYALMDF
jgi:hypothetical protein